MTTVEEAAEASQAWALARDHWVAVGYSPRSAAILASARHSLDQATREACLVWVGANTSMRAEDLL